MKSDMTQNEYDKLTKGDWSKAMEILDPRDIMILVLLKRGYSVRKISSHIGFRSPATTHGRIKDLITKEYLKRIAEPKFSNGWRLTDLGERTIKLYERKSNI